MKNFVYRGRNIAGTLINGVIQAASVGAAADQLQGPALQDEGKRSQRTSLRPPT